MKTFTLIAAALACALAAPAFADNRAVDEVLSSHSDLSDFYRAMQQTGVAAELKPDGDYTIFAPINSAFDAELSRDRSPCFHADACQRTAAEIVRNHIIARQVYMRDATQYMGGLHAVNGRFIPIGKTGPGDYEIGGNPIAYQAWLGKVMLYKINGVIADQRELADLRPEGFDAAPRTSQESTVSTHVIHDPACGPEGCIDARTHTTTITRTVTAPEISPSAR